MNPQCWYQVFQKSKLISPSSRLVILLNGGNMNRECSASTCVLLLTHHPRTSTSSARALPQKGMPTPELML